MQTKSTITHFHWRRSTYLMLKCSTKTQSNSWLSRWPVKTTPCTFEQRSHFLVHKILITPRCLRTESWNKDSKCCRICKGRKPRQAAHQPDLSSSRNSFSIASSRNFNICLQRRSRDSNRKDSKLSLRYPKPTKCWSKSVKATGIGVHHPAPATSSLTRQWAAILRWRPWTLRS